MQRILIVGFTFIVFLLLSQQNAQAQNLSVEGKASIGTTSTTHKLNVQSTDEETVRLLGPDGTFNWGARLNFGDSDYVHLDEDEDDKLTIYASLRTALMGGNVGIKTLDPTAPLHVVANSSTIPDQNGIYLSNPNNSSNQSAIIASRVAGADAGDPFVAWDISGVTGWSMGIDNSDGDKLKISNRWFDLANATKMTIQTNGNVGIGTTEPTAKLNIIGGTDVNGVSGGFLIAGNQNGVNLGLDDNEIQARNNGVPSTLSLQASGGNVIIGGGGYVGMNATPQSNLHIRQTGSNPVRGIRLEDGTSDYWTVYIDGANDYNFRYTNVLKAYILDTDGSYVQSSDRKLKKNIEPLEDVLPKVLQLQPKWYNYVDNQPGTPKSLGLIAQEVETVFPMIVHEKDGVKAVVYDNYAILSIKAIQELHTEIEAKDEKIEALEERLAKIEALLQGQFTINNPTINNSTTTLSSARLEQNQPNPFDGSTMVRYFIPEGVKKAELRITNLQGKVIKSVAIQARGEGQITFDATTLGSGTYQYSLFVDGQLLDTKQMVLTK